MLGTHESLYRGSDAIIKLARHKIAICGVGALGSNLADTLARQGMVNQHHIDDDRVESHNVHTQMYTMADVGALKVHVLQAHIYRAVGYETSHVSSRLRSDNVHKSLRNCTLIVDAFDNSESRDLLQKYCRKSNMPCLHVGLYEDYAEIVWDEHYRVPRDVHGDVCEYSLARNIVLLAVTVAAEVIVQWVLKDVRRSYTITLKDLCIAKM